MLCMQIPAITAVMTARNTEHPAPGHYRKKSQFETNIYAAKFCSIEQGIDKRQMKGAYTPFLYHQPVPILAEGLTLD